jgi:hypothetical protein
LRVKVQGLLNNALQEFARCRMPKKTEPLPTEEEILARFHRLRITIGLTQTAFGYMILGQPGLIRRLTEGKSLQVKSRRKCAAALDELEREHSVPIETVAKMVNKRAGLVGAEPVNKKATKSLDGATENIPIKRSTAFHSELED